MDGYRYGNRGEDEHKGLGGFIWNRRGSDEISKPAFVRATAFSTLLMAVVVAFGVVVSYDWPFTWLLLIGTFIVSIVAIFIFALNDNPFISLLGVTIMSLALGVMMGPVVATYTSVVVAQAILTTAAIMVLMSCVGIVYPRAFSGLGPYLLGALGVLILALFGQIIFGVMGFEWAAPGSVLDWVLIWAGILIFTIFVAYDWAKAMELPLTWDNAIDASGGLILDAVNLFVRLLEVYARSRR
ncbi:MAG: US12 family protein [Candidatus Colwellbacteria bacterium]|nr:US12 family protein [Candidatus Colwellbacteria bacterium]